MTFIQLYLLVVLTSVSDIFFSWALILFFFFLRCHLFIFRREGREKERERNINVSLPLACPLLETWPASQACYLTGNRTTDPLLCRLALSPLSHTSQGQLGFPLVINKTLSLNLWITRTMNAMVSFIYMYIYINQILFVCKKNYKQILFKGFYFYMYI